MENQTGRKTILIVEDNNGMRKQILKYLLGLFPDGVFLEAKDGEEAVALAISSHPDIVLMDIGLPKMNGIEATRQIKDRLPHTQIVMLTIHNDSVYKDAAFAAGAVAYVIKENMNGELVPIIQSLLTGSENILPQR
ncbi:MAG: response regulator transcription factor [Nitrospira sp.]|nr:response regulator transcription factor [Nitrospira sp.]